MKKERLIFVRGRWEIAHVQNIGADDKRRDAWHRRDQSWICDVGAEDATMPMPPKPRKESPK